MMTGQLFFPDSLSEQIFTSVAPYNDRRGKRDTSNAADGIARRAGPQSQAALRELEDAYQALMIVAVKPGRAAVTPPPCSRRKLRLGIRLSSN
ncbi:hypothetical protein [Mesorhizobium sp. M7A.F.Ca.US.011.01.1.1]|uniref:hypothetical protein n=1 Tax=Mesorhizobium sp. M7A.F.Ca.US.011.01.1.1 TaxID=2496741 RepID=UPI0032B01896